MQKIISNNRVPIQLWVDNLEKGALKQVINLANLPFAYKHIAIMPDCHQGFGMPIGGVLATEDVVIPNAVGVDIGCGMCAIKTNLTTLSKKELTDIAHEIRRKIPVGSNYFSKPQSEKLIPDTSKLPEHGIVKAQLIRARKQIGTLGGGNHFIEIQQGDDGHIWIMIHSGSRNLGKKVADYYNSKAKQLNSDYYSEVAHNVDLAFLPIKSKEAHNYFDEMNYCIDFAFNNRRLMMDRVKESINLVLKTTIQELEFYNLSHNYARWENHFGKNIVVHRKGATSAKKNEIGIIPGSQGTNSYIVEGLGNVNSFMSCSHGAGRKMSRRQAQKELVLEDEIALLKSKNIVHAIKTKKDLDEAPSAYKNIDEVMENQKDLVRIKVKLSPRAVVKG